MAASTSNTTTKTNTNNDEWADFAEWQGRLMAGVECGGPEGCLVWKKCTSEQGYGCMNVKWYYPETQVWKCVRRGTHRLAMMCNLRTHNSQPTTMSHISATTSFVAQWSTCPSSPIGSIPSVPNAWLGAPVLRMMGTGVELSQTEVQ